MFTCKDAWGRFSFATDGLARCTAILNLFTVLFGYGGHFPSFNVKIVFDDFKNPVGAYVNTFPAAVTFFSINNYEVVAGAVLISIMRLHYFLLA